MNKDLGEIIRIRRLGLYMSQTDLANVIGVTRIAVNDWEKGKRYPSIEHLRNLSIVLKIKPEVLFKELLK